MIAMFRMPRIRLVLVAAALLAMLVVPMAGARPASSSPLHSADSGWIGATLRWAEDLFRPRQSGHPGAKPSAHNKAEQTINATSAGGCIDPIGRPRPCL
jgi:hypothetical protein